MSESASLMVECAELSRAINAMQARLCKVAASGIPFESIGQAATLMEELRRAKAMLVAASFDLCEAIHAEQADKARPSQEDIPEIGGA